MDVALYLRKSRADKDAERRGEGDTLAKHKTALLKLAKHLKVNIIRISEEIVSGLDPGPPSRNAGIPMKIQSNRKGVVGRALFRF